MTETIISVLVIIACLSFATAPLWYRPKARKWSRPHSDETIVMSPTEAMHYMSGPWLPNRLPLVVVDYAKPGEWNNLATGWLLRHREEAERLRVDCDALATRG